MEHAGETNEHLIAKVKRVVTNKIQLDGNKITLDFFLGYISTNHSNQLSPKRAVAAKMSSYEYGTFCLKNSAKLT